MPVVLLSWASACGSPEDTSFAQDPLTEESAARRSPGGDRLPEITWKRSLDVGGRDPNGRRIAGTELRAMVAFEGKL